VTRVAWPRLMRLGMVDLGLSPDAFWALTPADVAEPEDSPVR